MRKVSGLTHSAVTDVGRVRRRNEDVYLADDAIGLYAVADGMGGHAAGDVASRFAIEALAREARSAAWPRLHGGFLRAAFRRAHQALLRDMRRHPEREGMGTTLTACTVSGGKLFLQHAGDSSLYLVRGSSCRRLTERHNGWMGGLDRCLGVSRDMYWEGQSLEEDVVDGDAIVLASDGLTGYTDEDPDIIARVLATVPAADAARALVDYALAKGGEDNATVVVVHVLGEGV